MKNEVAGGTAFSENFKELMQRIENRDTVKQMSYEELESLRKAIDDEVIRRKVVNNIQMLASQLK